MEIEQTYENGAEGSNDEGVLVKVFCCIDKNDEWQELGVGKLSAIENDCPLSLLLLVSPNNVDNGEPLLEANISEADTISKQDPNVITWCQAGKRDIALSFLNVGKCEACWKQIQSFKSRHNEQLDSNKNGACKTDDQISNDHLKDNGKLDVTKSDNCCVVEDDSCPIDGSVDLCRIDGSVDEVLNDNVPDETNSDETSIKDSELSNDEIGSLRMDIDSLESLAHIFLHAHLFTAERKNAIIRFLFANSHNLFDLCGFCSDIEDKHSLYHLNLIIRGMLRLNDFTVYTLMFDDEEKILQLVGVLEHNESPAENESSTISELLDEDNDSNDEILKPNKALSSAGPGDFIMSVVNI